jgi:hypothetical protein
MNDDSSKGANCDELGLPEFDEATYARLHLTPERWAEMRLDYRRREAIAPNVGDPAPEFHLPMLRDRLRKIRLSDFKGDRPVALIFGSYT